MSVRAPGNRVDRKKLLLSKWTAVAPVGKNKHFLVSALVLPDPPGGLLEWVDIEAVHSGATQRIRWRSLCDRNCWRQGWV